MNEEVLKILKGKSPKEALLRIRQAKDETQRLIDKEMKYSLDLRKVGYLQGLQDHMKKLEAYEEKIQC